MPTLLHSLCPFPGSTAKPLPELNPAIDKVCFFSCLTKNPAFSLTLNQAPCAASANTQEAISGKTNFARPNLNYKKITKKKLLDAYHLFVEMAEKGHRPVPSIGKTLIYNLCSLGMFRKAVRVAEIVLRSGTVLGKSVCSFIIENLINIGAYEYVVQLVTEMEQRGCIFDPNVYETLIVSLLQQATKCRVWQCLDGLIQKGYMPSNSYILSNMLDAAQLHKGADFAISVLYQILLRGGEPNTVCYNNILTALKKENRAEEALEIFSVLPTHMTSNLVTYNILLCALGGIGRWREAECLFDAMVEKGITPDIVTYKGLILVIANNGYAEEALKIAEELAQNGFKINDWCFNPIIAQFCSECRLDMVRKCLETMERWKCPFNSGTYRAISVLCKKGMLNEAFDILEFIRQKKGIGIQLFYGKVVLPYLCHKGNTFEALQILSKLVKLEYSPNTQTVSFFVKGLCMEGLHEEALELFEMLYKYNLKLNESSYNTLVQELCKNGRVDLAIMALERMVIKGYEPNESTYLEIVEGIGCLGKKDIVEELLMELNAREKISQRSVEIISLKFFLDNDGF